MTTRDLTIRGGSVIDGSGGALRTADVVVDAETIVEVGNVSGTHTICAGQEIYQNGVATGALPGRLILHAGLT